MRHRGYINFAEIPCFIGAGCLFCDGRAIAGPEEPVRVPVEGLVGVVFPARVFQGAYGVQARARPERNYTPLLLALLVPRPTFLTEYSFREMVLYIQIPVLHGLELDVHALQMLPLQLKRRLHGIVHLSFNEDQQGSTAYRRVRAERLEPVREAIDRNREVQLGMGLVPLRQLAPPRPMMGKPGW